MKKFPQVFGIVGLHPFFGVSTLGPRFTAIEDGGLLSLVEFELARKADGVAPSDPA